jgi:hypothetical protein
MSEVLFVSQAVSRTLYDRLFGSLGSPKGSNLQRMGNITIPNLSRALVRNRLCRMQNFSLTEDHVQIRQMSQFSIEAKFLKHLVLKFQNRVKRRVQ